MRKIPFSKVICDGNELQYVREVIESGWLTTAGKCVEFEKRFSEKVGGKYACAVNSATAALHIAAEALGIGPGDQVFVPTMTFTASAEIIRYLGADPVFLDVEYGTCLITPAILEAAIRQHPAAKALVLVHFGGQAAEMTGQKTAVSGQAGILEICRKHGLKLIEDAAHAFPSRLARIKFDFFSGDQQKPVEQSAKQPAEQSAEEPAKPAFEAIVKLAPQPA